MGSHTWRRVPASSFLLMLDAGARTYQRDLSDDGEHLSVIVTHEDVDGDGRLRAHLSRVHQGHTIGPGRYPTWDEQKEAVWPPEGEPYVNAHPTTFHWWETDELRRCPA